MVSYLSNQLGQNPSVIEAIVTYCIPTGAGMTNEEITFYFGICLLDQINHL